MSDSNQQMLLLILVIGGIAAMTMGSRSPTLNLSPNIKMGEIPTFDAAQNREDIENKQDKTVKDLMDIDQVKMENIQAFHFDDPTEQTKRVVNYMMYQVSTMYSALKWLEMYMQANNIRGIDDLRDGGKFEQNVVNQYQALVELCRTRQTQFMDLWTSLYDMGQNSWMQANQWIVNAPNDVLNRLRAFDNSNLAYKAAMQIMDSSNKQTMDQINSKLVDVYKQIGMLPSAKSYGKMSSKLREVVANQTIMMQIDSENAGKFALPMSSGQFANVKRSTHQARAPDEDPFSGKPGDYQLSAQWVDSRGQVQSANMSLEQAATMDINNPYSQPLAPGQVRSGMDIQATGMDIPGGGGGLGTITSGGGDYTMAPGETIALPPTRPNAQQDPSKNTGMYGSAYDSIDPGQRDIDMQTKTDLFGIDAGGGMFGDKSADKANETESYMNPPGAAAVYGPQDDMDSSRPPTRTVTVPPSGNVNAGGFSKAEANTVKIDIPRNAYAPEVVRRRPDEVSSTDSKRFQTGTDKPAPSQQQLEQADGDPFNVAKANQYDIIEGSVPRDELAPRSKEETWVGKSSTREVKAPPEAPQPNDQNTMYKDTTANATDLGIGVRPMELGAKPSDLAKSDFIAINPAKQKFLVNKSGLTGPTYRGRSPSMDMASFLRSPLKKKKGDLETMDEV